MVIKRIKKIHKKVKGHVTKIFVDFESLTKSRELVEVKDDTKRD